jgi:hypothetical protein
MQHRRAILSTFVCLSLLVSASFAAPHGGARAGAIGVRGDDPVPTVTRCAALTDAFVFDARPSISELTIPAGSTSAAVQNTNFGKGERKAVSIVNMNPFLYDYTVTVNRRTVADTAHLTFLGQLSPLLKAVIPADASASAAGAGLIAGAGAGSRGASLLPDLSASPTPTPPTSCPADKKVDATEGLKALAASQVEVQTWLAQAQTHFGALQSSYDPFEDAYTNARRVFFDPQADCTTLTNAARDWVTTWNDKTPFSVIETAERHVQGLLTEATALKNNADEFTSLYSAPSTAPADNCLPKVKGFFYTKSLSAFAQSAIEQANAYQVKINGMRENLARFERMENAVQLIFKHPEVTLRQDLEIGGFDEATVARVTVRRKSRDFEAEPRATPPPADTASNGRGTNGVSGADGNGNGNDGNTTAGGGAGQVTQFTSRDEGQIESPELRFGVGPRFFLSGGVVFSGLKKREFQPVFGVARNQDGTAANGNALAPVIGLEEESQFRVSPLLLLSTRLTERPRGSNLHWSFGIAAQNSDGTNLEYFTGPSVDILESKVFLTFGPYFGRQKRLAGDAFLNARPEGLETSSDIPVRSDLRVHVGFSFTYRILPRKRRGE